MPAVPSFSVLILTLNEERHLPACLDSLRGCDDIVVLDSGSTDRTLDIARAGGARVFNRPFDNFAAQRNYAHRAISFRNPWVFHLDADEQLTPALCAECAAIPPDAPFDGYYAAPQMIFAGRWLRHCTDYPAWQARLARAVGFQFVQAGHGQREAPGMRLGYLQAPYLHDITVTDLPAWERKHRRYAREEVAAFAEQRTSAWSEFRCALSGPGVGRRRALKRLSFFLPFRPALRLLYQYLLRGGLLDGRAGWRYCLLLARYECFIRDELRRVAAGARQP